jgi:hypothetical protein
MINPVEVRCPKCGARAGSPCRSASSNGPAQTHFARTVRADAAYDRRLAALEAVDAELEDDDDTLGRDLGLVGFWATVQDDSTAS